MAGEGALSPSQAKEDGKWRPTRSKTIPTHKRPPLSVPRRFSSLTSRLRRKSLSTISEEHTLSQRSNSSVNASFKPTLPYQPPTWTDSTEHLIHIHPSRQLQAFQSVSYYSVDEDNQVDELYWSTPRVYRTQSQWSAQPYSYIPSGISRESSTTGSHTASLFDTEDSFAHEEIQTENATSLPREAIADLFQRVEDYERTASTEETSGIFLRGSEASQGLSRTLSALRRTRTFEARVSHNSPSPPRDVPRHSQLRVVAKPTRTKRLCRQLGKCWRRLTNWSVGRKNDVKVVAGNEEVRVSNVANFTGLDVSIVSFSLNESSTPQTQTQTQTQTQRRVRVVEWAEGGAALSSDGRKDSARDFEEGEKEKRRESLFLDEE